MEQSTDDITTEDIRDAEVFAITTPSGSANCGIDQFGQIYLSGDLHPGGSSAAIAEALTESVEWIPMNAVDALFPLNWLAAKCLGSPARTLIIHNLETLIRGRG